MHGRPRIIDFLSRVHGDAADQALVAGLPHLSSANQREVVDLLLERATPTSLAALPDCFDRVDPAAQTKIVLSVAKLFEALRTSIRHPRLETRANTLTIVRECGSPRLAYLAALGLQDGSSVIRGQAAEALRQLTVIHDRNRSETTEMLLEVGPVGIPLTTAAVGTLRMLAEERGYLVSAIKDALNAYESHHRPEVIQAALMVVEDLGDELFTHAATRRGNLSHVIFEIVTDRLAPRDVPFMYLALAQPELRPRVTHFLSRCLDAAFFQEFVRQYAYGRLPAVRAGLRAVRSLAWLENDFEAAFTLPPEIAQVAPAWIEPLGIHFDAKVAALRSLARLDDSRTTRAVAWMLTRINTAAGTSLLEEIAASPHADAARIARRELVHRARAVRRTDPISTPQRPQEWTNLLRSASIEEDFSALLEGFERVPEDLARAAGPLAVRFISDLTPRLRQLALARDPHRRARAARFLAYLGLTSTFPDEVVALAKDVHPDVRAAGIAALGQLRSTTSRRILERAVGDDAPAVQIAAIEALDAIASPSREQLLTPLTASENPHVRAAAIAALIRLRVPAAATGLVYMLCDPRQDHRCAALWIVDRMRLTALTARIAELASSEADPRVQRVARHVLNRLESASERTGDPERVGSATAPAAACAPAPEEDASE